MPVSTCIDKHLYGIDNHCHREILEQLVVQELMVVRDSPEIKVNKATSDHKDQE